jgi:hypothetical protein
MLSIIAGLAGFVGALVIHWGTWYTRQKQLTLALVAGALSTIGVTVFCLLFLNSDIARQVMIALGILWVIALGLGLLQASSLRLAWWKGVLGVFFEMGLAFLLGSAVNLTMQRYMPWFEERFPGVEVYALINAFLWTMIITLLLLAIIRPLLFKKKET